MQDDQLLSGSVADNICFFDPDYNQEKLLQCTRLAGIHDEIMAMPMTYNSLVGDMGSSLSAGQKQRVLLARALCIEPRIDVALSEAPLASDPNSRNLPGLNQPVNRPKIDLELSLIHI